MKIPSRLNPGDKVAVVSPAGIIDVSKLEKGLQKIREWGLEPIVAEHVFDKWSVFAGTDEARFEDMKAALENPEIKAVFAGRGGYGTTRILEMLKAVKPSHPKWIVGYSDITALHAFVGRVYGWASLHAPCVSSFIPDEEESQKAWSLMHDVLFLGKYSYDYAMEDVDPGMNLSGVVVGGNLSLLCALRGTDFEVRSKGRILLIEDVDEYNYAVDRMLMAEASAHRFDSLKGILAGEFVDMKDGSVPFADSIRKMIEDKTRGKDYPKIFGFPVGHGLHNYPVVLGTELKIRAVNGLIRVRQSV